MHTPTMSRTPTVWAIQLSSIELVGGLYIILAFVCAYIICNNFCLPTSD